MGHALARGGTAWKCPIGVGSARRTSRHARTPRSTATPEPLPSHPAAGNVRLARECGPWPGRRFPGERERNLPQQWRHDLPLLSCPIGPVGWTTGSGESNYPGQGFTRLTISRLILPVNVLFNVFSPQVDEK